MTTFPATDSPQNIGDAPVRRTGPSDWLLACAIAAIVACLYLPRLTELTIRGEESGWSRVGTEMEETGDWFVPQLQHTHYIERPPLGSWLMQGVSKLTGSPDLLSVRLPSVLATIVLSLVIFVYGRTFLSQTGAFAAALFYPTMAQVMTLGRLGESEALFSCLLASSLLVWHAGYVRGWTPAAYWSAGYALAALAALTKGLQAIIYFDAVTIAFLVLRWEWRPLFALSRLVGVVVMVAIIGAWAVPFYFQTDAKTFFEIWTGLVADRVQARGLLSHVFSYPFEVVACSLPWSLLLFLPLVPRFRPLLSGGGQQLRFLLTALVITFPTVWFVAHARGRYYVPMFPCVALVAGLVWERWCGPVGEKLAGLWRQRVAWYAAATCAVMAIGIAGLGSTLGDLPPVLEKLRPSPGITGIVLLMGLAASALFVTVASQTETLAANRALLACVAALGTAFTGVVLDRQIYTINDIAKPTAEIKAALEEHRLVSLGPICHRFSWYYGETIPLVPWPETLDQLPPDLDYFCFNVTPGDTPERRLNGRGRDGKVSCGTLPFEWELVSRVAIDAGRREGPEVVVARVKRSPDGRVSQKGSAERH